MSNCFLDARVRGAGLDPWRLGGDIWGYLDDDTLHSVVYVGANLVPVGTTRVAGGAGRSLRMAAPLLVFVGDREEVLDLWRLLEPAWGPAREVRDDQRLLVMDTDANIPHDPHVRMATWRTWMFCFPRAWTCSPRKLVFHRCAGVGGVPTRPSRGDRACGTIVRPDRRRPDRVQG